MTFSIAVKEFCQSLLLPCCTARIVCLYPLYIAVLWLLWEQGLGGMGGLEGQEIWWRKREGERDRGRQKGRG